MNHDELYQVQLFDDIPLESSPTIKCDDCGEQKLKSEFYGNPQTKNGLDAYCTTCKLNRSKSWRARNPSYASEYGKQYYRKNKDSELSRALVGSYGITLDEKGEMLESQNGQCAICEKKLTLMGRGTHVDHDHKTKAIRAILCNNCNAMIGHANENVEILRKAIEYLSRYSSLETIEHIEAAEEQTRIH